MLNPQQQAVVEHPGNRPLLVIAGAGTGKTTVMVHRVAELVARGADPHRLLLLTFTRRAAEELRCRVAAKLKLDVPLPWCGTFHSVAAKLLRRFATRLGRSPGFSILDESDSRDLLLHGLKEIISKPAQEDLPGKALLISIHSYMANTQQSLEDVLDQLAPRFAGVAESLRAVFERYRTLKIEANAYDYDDLLLGWLDLLRRPELKSDAFFDCIMVDEYQDTNIIQSNILLELCKTHRNITVVGDDAQAIYAFRGASVENILNFERQFPEVIRLKLEENYRSTQEILDAANALWGEAARGFQKELTAAKGAGVRPRLDVCRDEWDQAEKIVAAISEAWVRDHVPLREQAVLFRASNHSFRLEMKLNECRIPFKKYGGQRLADMAHAKDLLAFLRVHENPKDLPAWQRILAMLPGVGPASAGKLATLAANALLPHEALAAASLPKKAAACRGPFLDLLRTQFGDSNNTLELKDELDAILAYYEPLLPELYDFPEIRREGVREIATAALKFKSRRELLDELMTGDDSAVRNPARESDEFLTLSTIHSAKGCEWRRVHVMQLTEGGLPNGAAAKEDRKIEEERRLLYVAMTRAKEWLTLYQPLQREVKDQQGSHHERALPSRFLTPAVLAVLGGGGRDGRFSNPDARQAARAKLAAAAADPDELIYDYDEAPRRPPPPARPFRRY